MRPTPKALAMVLLQSAGGSQVLDEETLETVSATYDLATTDNDDGTYLFSLVRRVKGVPTLEDTQ